MYTVQVEGERASWHQVVLPGRRLGLEKKKRRAEKGEEEEEDDGMDSKMMEDLALEDQEPSGPTTVTVESGAFTISSTVAGQTDLAFLSNLGQKQSDDPDVELVVPSARFNSGLVYKSGSLYLFGGLWEAGEKDYTLKDFYSLDTKKCETWSVLIEDDVRTMEWVEEDEDDDEDEESGMDTD